MVALLAVGRVAVALLAVGRVAVALLAVGRVAVALLVVRREDCVGNGGRLRLFARGESWRGSFPSALPKNDRKPGI